MMKKNEVKIAPRVNIIEECRREIYILVPNKHLHFFVNPYLRNPTFVCPAPGRLIPIGKFVRVYRVTPSTLAFRLATRNTRAT